ncbi:hypothetical protein [Corynebacterium glyciniphilum]|uniref:hypothetical protein n=1 Tax=Corynebacterium glyciniphilum TaxID=1404244 RepID=UPI003FCF0BE0
MEPTTNLPVNNQSEPKYLNVTANERLGGYDTAVIIDPTATPRDRFQMAVQIMVEVTRQVARDLQDPRPEAMALEFLRLEADTLMREDARITELFTPPIEGNGDDEDA